MGERLREGVRGAFLTLSLGGGGAERTLLNLATQVRSVEWAVITLLAQNDYVALSGELDVLHVQGDFTSGSALERARRLVHGLFEIKRVKQQEGLDMCVSFGFWANLLNVLSRGSERVVLSERTTLSRDLAPIASRDLFGLFVRSLYPRADCVVALSEGVKRDLMDHYGLEQSQVEVIFNPVVFERLDPMARAPLPLAFCSLEDTPFILCVGRLVEAKGHWHMLRAFAAMEPSSRPRLVLLGQGRWYQELVDLAERLGLRCAQTPLDDADADVFMPGFVANPYAFMSRASLFAFTSLWEGLGNSLVEAMACGAPVIAADCDHGPRELILGDPGSYPAPPERYPFFGERGVLMAPFPARGGPSQACPQEVYASWAKTMQTLLAERERASALGRAARAHTRAFFRPHVITAQWEAVLSARLPLEAHAGAKKSDAMSLRCAPAETA